MTEPTSISAYVLAGGQSSRMGLDKALLELAGKPLVAHAVAKLRRISSEVFILAGAREQRAELGGYAPVVYDLHPGCGPIGGLEAALAHTGSEWNLILPVDLPFLPTLFLERWVRLTVHRNHASAPVAMFSVSGRPQPTLLVIHRNVGPFLTQAIARGHYKLLPVLETAVRDLAAPDAPRARRVPHMLPIDENLVFDDWEVPPAHVQPWQLLSAAQRANQSRWFANLNTPEEFAEAQLHADALDT